MQLLAPHINTVGSRRKKPTAKQRQAKAEHDAWLRKHGVHRDQLKDRPKLKPKLPSYQTEQVALSNTIVDGGRDRSIMGNLYKEPEAVREQVLAKARRTEMAYNKGGLVYVTDGMDIKTMGARSRRP